MPMMKPLLTLSITALLGVSVAAFAAQDDDATPRTDSSFTLADADMSGVVSRTEFPAFVEDKARLGDDVYADILQTGDYDLAFAERDLNADGALDKGELGAVETPAMESDWSDAEVDMTPAPEVQPLPATPDEG